MLFVGVQYNLVKRVLPQCRELDPTLADRFRTLKLEQSRNLDFPKVGRGWRFDCSPLVACLPGLIMV